MASIQDAINQASAAAEKMAADESQAAATPGTDLIEGNVNSNGHAVTFAKPSMKSVQAATGLLPRSTLYLKPTEYGFRVGKNKDLIQDFEAELDMNEGRGFQLKHTVRFGNPAQYLSSYDGVTCNKGGSWHDALMKARQASGGNAEPYFAAEIKLTLTKDIKLKEETIPAGTIIGYDTSAPSRFSDWSDFYEAMDDQGKTDQVIKVNVIAKEIEHNGNNWGTVSFELVK